MGSWGNLRAQDIAQQIIADCETVFGPSVLVFYAGGIPATLDESPSPTPLAILAMSEPAFADSPGDIAPGYRITANAITDDSSADATGTPTYCRIVNGGGTNIVQLSVSATGGGGEVQITPSTITAGQPVSVTSLTLTVPEA